MFVLFMLGIAFYGSRRKWSAQDIATLYLVLAGYFIGMGEAWFGLPMLAVAVFLYAERRIARRLAPLNERLRSWRSDLREFPMIDWSWFAVTRGGFFDRSGAPCSLDDLEERPAITASGGWCAPTSSFYGLTPTWEIEPGWHQWRPWHPPVELLPAFRAARGSIHFPPHVWLPGVAADAAAARQRRA